MRQFIITALAFICLHGLSSCAVNPATGTPNLVLMSEGSEIELGKEEHEKVLATQKVYEDEKLTSYVNEIGNRMARVSDRPDLEYTFTVIDSPEINAFALPGGYIYVNRGLINYTNSEAELAAVIAHEIGHVTARHHVQRHARTRMSQVATSVGGIVTAVATGNGYIGSQVSQIGSIWAVAGLSGFGREDELEADGLAAQYLYRGGYDPTAMIDVIATLKNQEDFRRRVTGEGGGYHGVFASHPRNDLRLQQTINNVGQLSQDQVLAIDESVFRDKLEGVVVGESIASQTRDDRNRYYQSLLGYTMVFPEEWQFDETTTTVTATGPNGDSLFVEAQRITENINPRAFIQEKLGLKSLQKTEDLDQYRLIGFTGVLRDVNSGGPERIAVIYMGPRAFVFRGKVADLNEPDRVDAMLLASIRSFRAIQRGEIMSGGERKIKYIQVGEGFDFSTLAVSSPLTEHPEETLRLLNGYYPLGTPQPGEWIKVVE